MARSEQRERKAATKSRKHETASIEIVVALTLLRREAVWRSGRHGSPDRARRLWEPASSRSCGQRPVLVLAARSGHRNSASRRGNVDATGAWPTGEPWESG